MKLKCLFGTVIAALAVSAGVSAVYADDQAAFTVGNPIDITTGEEVEEISEGQLLAFPVDFEESVQSYGFQTDYDKTILSAGVDVSVVEANDSIYDVLDKLGEPVEAADDSSKYVMLNGFGTTGRKGFSGYGNPTAVLVDKGTNMLGVNWYHSAKLYPNTDKGEFYLLFTAVGSVSADDLNVSLFTPYLGKSYLDDSNYLEGEANKANACAGAFKVSINNDELKYYIQGLYAQINGINYELTEYVNADGSSVYEFPARIITDSTDSVEVSVYAKTSSDEAGTKNVEDKLLATKTISLDGTVSNYDSLS